MQYRIQVRRDGKAWAQYLLDTHPDVWIECYGCRVKPFPNEIAAEAYIDRLLCRGNAEDIINTYIYP